MNRDISDQIKRLVGVRALLLSAITLMTGVVIHAAPSPPIAPSDLITNPGGRTGVMLDGAWDIIVDPLSSGDANPVAVGVEGAGFYQDQKQTSPMQLIEYRFSDKVRLNVPGDWNTQSERLFFYQGPVWYRTTLARPTAAGRHFLYFGAVNYKADIYINGLYLASHEGGFTPFNIDVTDQLHEGENLLVVKVDNTLSAETVPTRKTDWLNYGGITRSVRLLTVPKHFVQNYGWRLVDLDKRTIEVTVDAPGAMAGEKVEVEILTLKRKASIVIGNSGTGHVSFNAPVQLWSPDTPVLYDVSLTFKGETIRDRVGFRTIETRGGEILLNGKPIFLKGISMHEESLTHPGRAFGPADARASLELVKKLGANFVRPSHYPHDEATTKMADELGLLVWSEIPVYWSVDWTSPAALATAKQQLKENITRDRNRASVVVWSVANEAPISAPRLSFLTTLVDTVRGLDSSRLVSAALFGDPRGFLKEYSARIMARVALDPATTAERRAIVLTWFREKAKMEPTSQTLVALTAPNTYVINDPLGDVLDIVAYNQYLGWYPAGFLSRLLPIDEATIRRAEFSIMKTLEIEPKQDKPFIISEFGADAKRGFIGDRETVFSEQFQAQYYRAQFGMLANSNKLRGMVPWLLKDFRSPLRTHPDYQNYYNRKGLVDETGQPKASFSVLQDLYMSMGGSTRLPKPTAEAGQK